MSADPEMIRKRQLVGLLSLAGLLAGVLLLVFGSSDALASALLRGGVLLGTLWLALPTARRPAAWSRTALWPFALIIIIVALFPRIRPILPVLLIGFLIGWIVRPRRHSEP